MKISAGRLVIGLIFSIIGIVLIIISIFSAWGIIFYGVSLLIIGIVILFNKNEDKIEKRKDLKEKTYKK